MGSLQIKSKRWSEVKRFPPEDHEYDLSSAVLSQRLPVVVSEKIDSTETKIKGLAPIVLLDEVPRDHAVATRSEHVVFPAWYRRFRWSPINFIPLPYEISALERQS